MNNLAEWIKSFTRRFVQEELNPQKCLVQFLLDVCILNHMKLFQKFYNWVRQTLV